MGKVILQVPVPYTRCHLAQSFSGKGTSMPYRHISSFILKFHQKRVWCWGKVFSCWFRISSCLIQFEIFWHYLNDMPWWSKIFGQKCFHSVCSEQILPTTLQLIETPTSSHSHKINFHIPKMKNKHIWYKNKKSHLLYRTNSMYWDR